MPKSALITGVTGQDGSYLAELLLDKGYIVHGVVRRSSSFNRGRIEHLYQYPDKETRFHLHYADMADPVSLINVLLASKPDERYNLAAQSHVKISYETPVNTAHVTGVGLLNLIEAVRSLGLKTRIYQASTSELYSGDPTEAPQNELTPFKPQSPYAVAKLYAHEIARVYRDAYGMFICNGILFNHESERRGENFVTRKITLGVADIVHKKKDRLVLGNIDASRDWGYAPEYVEGMWRMLQQEKPGDYVLATGETHTVREFLEHAFKAVELNWEDYVSFDKSFLRPNEVNYLCGDYSKAKQELGWKPTTTFDELVYKMVIHDVHEN